MTLVGLVRAALYVSWTLACLPVQFVLMAAGRKARHAFPQFYHRTVLQLIGLRLDVRGSPCRRRPCLYVCNHTSYLDIPVLGALIRGSFVAKAEVNDWPFFGLLARLQRTVFVDRRRSQVGRHMDAVGERLDAREQLILFPEGTTSDGNRILPFKSALFASAQQKVNGKDVTVQPVSVAYARFSNLPMDREMRPFYAWYGDMDLLPHMWEMLKAGVVTVIVQFHPVTTITETGGDRRSLAHHCEAVVREGHSQALSGRLPPRRRRRLRKPGKPRKTGIPMQPQGAGPGRR